MKKGYKVTDVRRDKKFGVAAQSLKELIEKSRKKLEVSVNCAECRVYVAEDGTLVDDDEYLASLPPQTLLILIRNNENMVTDFEHYYNLIRSTKQEYIDTGNAAKDFLSTNIKEKFKVFQKYIAMADDKNTLLSDRKDDPAWFEGLEPCEKTKEQTMSKRLKDRMRGYYYKTKTSLQNSDLYVHSKNTENKVAIDQFLHNLRKLLESVNYNQGYFDRRAEKSRLCDSAGLFQCQGLWNSSTCVYGDSHTINPYRSREERIIFQTWNFDHKIELSRSIIPRILESFEFVIGKSITCMFCEKSAKEGCVESERYYLQIFTVENLKLVHIVCHCKSKHDIDSDVYMVCRKCFGKQINSIKK